MNHSNDVYDESNPFGDYFVEEDLVERGVTFHHDTCTSFGFDAFDIAKSIHEQPDQLADIPFGGVACTSFTLMTLDAADALRSVRNFLEADLAGTVKKVSLPKCSVTAEIILEVCGRVSQCEVKARLFRSRTEVALASESCQLVLELTRRSGDQIAFAEVFRRAVASLNPKSDEGRQSQQSESIAVPPEVLYEQVDCMQPIVDLVRGGMTPESQAEGLTALVLLTKSPAAVAEVYAACANLQTILVHLTTSPLLQVSYLAALLNSWHHGRACCLETSTAGVDDSIPALGLELNRRHLAMA